MSSGKYSGLGAGNDKPIVVNSLLNAFVPEDLVTFSMIPTPAPKVDFNLPPAPATTAEVTSEIDLAADEEIETIGDLVSHTEHGCEHDLSFNNDEQSNLSHGFEELSLELRRPESIPYPIGQNPIDIVTPASNYFTQPYSVPTRDAPSGATVGPENVASQVDDTDNISAPSQNYFTELGFGTVPDGLQSVQSFSRPISQTSSEVPLLFPTTPNMVPSTSILNYSAPELNVTSEILSNPSENTSLPSERYPGGIGEPNGSITVSSNNVTPITGSYPVLLQQSSEVDAPCIPPSISAEAIIGNGIWPLGQLGQSSSTPNTFRMSRQQKPVYAKYPGLSSDNVQASHHPQQPLGAPPLSILDGGNRNPALSPPMISSTSMAASPLSPSPDFVAPASFHSLANASHTSVLTSEASSWDTSYKPVFHHWFFRKDGEIWKPFSHVDSKNLEEAFTRGSSNLVSVDGGRHDVDLEKRIRQPVYWEDTEVTHVQRCSWFYKGPMDSQFIPYSESFSARLEEEYETSCRTNTWQKRLEFSGGEAVVLQGPHSFVHFCQQASADEWGSVPESQLRPRLVKRGPEGLQIPPAEPAEIDYLVFLVHGIGSFCDFKFRSVVETVDDFRQISNQMLQSHFKEATGRVEFLPIQWHKALHGDGGIDEKLKPLTLKSIPKLRHFTNDTLLDILFYTSPVYCQTIMNTVGNEMNRMFSLFLDRNPTFNCLSVAVAGHSLGSLILFDLLAHQPELVPIINSNLDMGSSDGTHNSTAGNKQSESGENRLVSYRMGSAGTGQPSISYPVLDFQPTAFFAMGSPIAMFVAVRGLDSLGLDFHFPTCPAFFNIFHPYDPVAYRIESLIDPTLDLRPVLIPHHKGRKRFHLELKETMARVGTDLKNRVMESLRVTYKAVTQLAGMAEVEHEVDNAIATQLTTESSTGSGGLDENKSDEERKVRVGSLNGGRRIDHVLQEAPHQILNEYLFALSSHVCYWESEDTVLLILNEILNEGRSTPSTPEPSTPVDIPAQPFSFSGTVESTQAHLPLTHAPPPPGQMQVHPPSGQMQVHLLSGGMHVPPPPGPGGIYTTGKRPLMEPNFMPLGMDPTAPIKYDAQTLPPPPKSGFRPKN